MKESIHKQQGHAVELQKLIFSGKILENDKTIESYGIKEKDFLVVMVSKVRRSSHPAESRQARAQGRGAQEGGGSARCSERPGRCSG